MTKIPNGQLTTAMMTREAARLLHQFLPKQVVRSEADYSLRIEPTPTQLNVYWDVDPELLIKSLDDFSKEILVPRIFALSVEMIRADAAVLYNLVVPRTTTEAAVVRYQNISVRGVRYYKVVTDAERIWWDVLFTSVPL